MEYLERCPVCSKTDFSAFMTVEDHFLSKNSFKIVECKTCSFRFVNPRPPESEIPQYYSSQEYFSHAHSNKSFFYFLYKNFRKLAVRKKYKIVHKFSDGHRILDIGCGTGEFLTYCRKKGFDVYGIEPEKTARTYAGNVNGLDIIEKLAEVDHLINETVTCVTMWHVLEHVHDLNETMEIIGKVLKPGGVLIIAIPNHKSWDSKYFKSFWAAYDVPRHLYHFTKESVIDLAGRYQFTPVKIRPQILDAFFISVLSLKYKTGKTNYFMAFLLGLLSNIFGYCQRYGHSSLIIILKSEKRPF